MNQTFTDEALQERWDSIVEPGFSSTNEGFARYMQTQSHNRNVLYCAVPLARARNLTDFEMPAGWDVDKCLVASGSGNFPAGLHGWEYQPRIKAEAQLPQMQPLPPEHASLLRSTWLESPSQATWFGINARHLRYHHQLWKDLNPKVLRGVHTTIVFATPQIGFSLAPHINLADMFLYFGAMARAYAPIQLFPAGYIYPEANLRGLAETPAPIFADILPVTGGNAFPIMEWTPDPWGTIANFDVTDRQYGYPFSRARDSVEDFSLVDYDACPMLLPNGQTVKARHSESFVYATLDPKLREELMRDREAFEESQCLVRGTITHDGLPFQLPVELQSMVYAVILTQWEMELDKPGDLTSYSVKTQHAAIRGYNFFQKRDPFYGNFMRMIHELAKDPAFKTYPLATHLTHPWLGGNLRLSNQRSYSEDEIGADLMRNYNLQQLDWMAGVCNLWNHVSFRKGQHLEKSLNLDGLAFHQMRRMLRFDSPLFQRPLKRASFWPDIHPGWTELDRTHHAKGLPKL